jgi:preprotein translocase subunit SecA
MSPPSREYHRATVRVPGKLPVQLDAVAHGLTGRWRRRRAETRALLAEATAVIALEGATQDLSHAELHTRLVAHRQTLLRRKPGAWAACGCDALAALREAARRHTGLLAHPEQIAAVLALRRGVLAEMATGEGKSLVAAIAAVTFAWEAQPVHVVTVNDYLAERDAAGFARFFGFCGLRAAAVRATDEREQRQSGHAADITYTTAKELLGDFLRDRLARGPRATGSRDLIQNLLTGARAVGPAAAPTQQRPPAKATVLRGIHTVIVDEADSILIDEAVTPLILSQPRENVELLAAARQAAEIAQHLQPGRDYLRDERYREVRLTEEGRWRLETIVAELGEKLKPSPPSHDPLPRSASEVPETAAGPAAEASGLWRGARRREELVVQALHAREYFAAGRNYVIDDGKVVIVDEYTGRMMPQRTWREGLHQAIEAKEGVEVTSPTDIVGRMSFQHFFRLFPRRCGMTGTARENASELWHVFELPVVAVPRHRPLRLELLPSRGFASAPEKWNAVVDEIAAMHHTGRPVLVGMRSVAASEALSARLTSEGLPHHVLNAVRHREEASIVSQAGDRGRITLATNMAGRGTDIRLEDGLAEIGGLHVIATEFHEAGRIDRQLFGRCARQGDRGSCRMFFSLEDELYTRFVPQWVQKVVRACPWMWHAALRSAQRAAERQARRQRSAVLRADEWLREALTFVPK